MSVVRRDKAPDGEVRGSLTTSPVSSFGLLTGPADPASTPSPMPTSTWPDAPAEQSGLGLSLQLPGPSSEPQLLTQLLLLTAGPGLQWLRAPRETLSSLPSPCRGLTPTRGPRIWEVEGDL